MGWTEQKLEGLGSYHESENFSETEKLALEYADRMTRTPVDVPDELFTKLRERFNEPQLVELSMAIAWDNFKARFHHALEIKSEDFSAGQFCPLPVRSSLS